MKILICLIFVFAFFIHGQTTYYISSSQGNDSYNGLTPETPKKTLAALQALFKNAKPGDKFLLKRGDTWTMGANVYTDYSHGTVGLDMVDLDGTSGNYITVGAYGTGNKPQLKFDYYLNGVIKIEGANYVIIENLQLTSSGTATRRPDRGIFSLNTLGGGAHYVIIRDCTIDHLMEALMFNDNQSHHLTIDNCTITDNYPLPAEGTAYRMGIAFFNITNFTISNCYLARNGRITDLDPGGHDHDIYISYVNTFVVEGNEIDGTGRGNSLKLHGDNGIVRNNIFYGSKYTAIQTGNYDELTMTNMVIEKNKFYNVERGIIVTPQSKSIFAQITGLIIKNNIIYNANMEGILVNKNTVLSNSLFVNNTIYNCLYGIRLYSPSSYGNLQVKNNIFYNDTYSSGALFYISSDASFYSVVFDHNLYYSITGVNTNVVGTNRTLAQFKSVYTTQEVNGISGNPLFVNPTSDFRLQNNSTSVSPAINRGTNLSQVIDDFDGNGRPFDGTSDIGAYEYRDGTTPPVDPPPTTSSPSLNMKLFLEGPYNNGSMNTTISGILPLSQPFNTTIWNYGGEESVSNIPSGIVDWILIELRSNTSGSSLVARKAAFVKNDGKVVDLDGNSNVKFDGLSSGDYYVVIRHRNHVDIMSSSTVQLSESPVLYDFTTSQSQAYGSYALVNLGNNVWGMYAGDGDKNGLINVIDYGSVGNYLFETGYKPGDIDMNGTINVIDYGKTNSNLFKVSQVPN